MTIAGALPLLAGCSNESAPLADPPIPSAARESKGATDQSAQEQVLATGPFEKTFDNIRFSVPAGWKDVPLSPQQQGFVDARMQIPTKHGEVSLTFSSNAGGIQSNVQRWIGQFQLPPGEKAVVEEIEIAGKRGTWVDLHGEFAAGPMGAASGRGAPVERMLGVAIPLGARDFYLKLTGTNRAVGDARASFREFVRGARIVAKDDAPSTKGE